MDRRTFLTAVGATTATRLDVSAATGTNAAQVPARVPPPTTSRTILAIGAHYDDAPFGIPGILLQAVAQGHRVVILAMIGDYANWKPVRGRSSDIVEGTRRINAEYGAESRFLPWASGRLPSPEAGGRAVADVVAEVKADTAFVLWSRDQHPDHEAAAELSKLALHLGDRVLPDPFAPYTTPRRSYMYDNGPRHTLGFVPDTFVDVTNEWSRSIEWLGKLMALTRNQPHAGGTLDGAQRLKESLARYRGATCGVQYAEAVASANAYPQSLF